MRARLGVEDPEAAVAHAHAARLALLRRYSAKLAYELELHGGSAELDEMPSRYSALLSDALRVPWPRESWLADVDEGFYAACYLRAWALEYAVAGGGSRASGGSWFESAAAGEWVRGLWRRGTAARRARAARGDGGGRARLRRSSPRRSERTAAPVPT